MPNTREKLIELLQCSPTDIMGNRGVGALADHLIANGVTVQEWISVKDRLPEEKKMVLVNRKGVISVEFQCGCGWSYDYFTKFPVTHWMPLPEAPKGE